MLLLQPVWTGKVLGDGDAGSARCTDDACNHALRRELSSHVCKPWHRPQGSGRQRCSPRLQLARALYLLRPPAPTMTTMQVMQQHRTHLSSDERSTCREAALSQWAEPARVSTQEL